MNVIFFSSLLCCVFLSFSFLPRLAYTLLVPPSLPLILHFKSVYSLCALLVVVLLLLFKLILLYHNRDLKKTKKTPTKPGREQKNPRERGAVRMDEGELRWQRSGYGYSKRSTLETLEAQRDQILQDAAPAEQSRTEVSTLRVYFSFLLMELHLS